MKGEYLQSPLRRGTFGDLRQAKKGELAGNRGKRIQAGWTEWGFSDRRIPGMF